MSDRQGRRKLTTTTSTSTATSTSTSTSTSTTTTSSTTTTTLPGQGTAVLENGGTVTVAVPSLPVNLDPLVPTGANRVTTMATAQIWPSVFTINNKLIPILNSQFITSAYLTSLSPQTIVYTIAKGATWSDGVPITAIDFLDQWHEQLAYGSQLPPEDPVSGYQDISSVTGSNDGRTVTVTFTTPDSSWEALFSPLLPAHAAPIADLETDFTTANSAEWISGGPFTVVNFIPGVELELQRNPEYWGTPARVENIIFSVVPGDRAVLRALHNGTVGIGVVSPGRTEAALVAGASGFSANPALSPTQWQIAFNLAGPTLGQPGVRHAIALAIDRHELVADSVNLQIGGTPTVGNRVYAAGAPLSVGNDGDFSTAKDSKADASLTALGYSVDPLSGIVLTPLGAPLTLTLVGPTGSPAVLLIEALLRAQLLAAGITLEVRNVPINKLLGALLPAGQYEMALAPFDVPEYPAETEPLYTDPVGPTPLNIAAASAPSSSTTLPPTVPGRPAPSDSEPGALVSSAVSRDIEGFGDPEITSLYSQAAAELSAPLQADLYNEVDQTLWRDMPTLPLFQQPVVLISKSDILNVTYAESWDGPLWNAQNWVIELSATPVTSTTSTTTTLAP